MAASGAASAVTVRLLETLVSRVAPHQPSPPLLRLALRLLASPLFDRPPLSRPSPSSLPFQALLEHLNDLHPLLAPSIVRLLVSLEASSFPPITASLPKPSVPPSAQLPVVISAPTTAARTHARSDWHASVALDAWHAAQGVASVRVEKQGTHGLAPRSGVYVEGNARADRMFALCATCGSAVVHLDALLTRASHAQSLCAQAAALVLRSHYITTLTPLLSLRAASAASSLSSAKPSTLSLARVMAVAIRITTRLAVLSLALAQVSSLTGVALCNALHTAALATADPDQKSLYVDLLRAACAPLMRQVSNALIDGSISDPHAEAFLAVQSAAVQWHEMCALRVDSALVAWLPPSVLPHVVAAVRALLFLRMWARDLAWLDTLRASTPLELSYMSAAMAYPFVALVPALTAYASQLEARAASLLRAANAAEQLRVCHDCLALSNAPFASALLAAHAGTVTGKGAFARPRLLAALDDAARSAALPLHVAARLDVLLLPIDTSSTLSTSSTSMRDFALAYNADAPFSLLLSASSIRRYAPTFQLVWGVRHAEARAAATWKALGRILTTRRAAALTAHALLVLLRALLSLFHSHFAPALHALLRSLTGATTVDMQLQAHSDYMAAIQPSAMLPLASLPLLDDLLSLIDTWCTAQHAIVASSEGKPDVNTKRTMPAPTPAAKGKVPSRRAILEVRDDDEEEEADEREQQLKGAALTARASVARSAGTLRSALAFHMGPVAALADLLIPLSAH